MQKYRNQIFLGILITLAIYIGFLVFADSQGQLAAQDGILEKIRNFPLQYVLLAILFQCLVIFFRFIKWQYYLKVIEAHDKISLLDSLIIFVASFTLVVSPGKVAELLKSVLLKTKTDTPIARSAPVIIVERVVDGLAVLILMVLILFFAGEQLNLGTYNGIDYEWLSKTLLYSSFTVIGIALIVIQIQPLAYFFLNIIPKLPLVKRLHQPLVDFYESSREIFSLRHVIPMTIVGTGVYLNSAFCFLTILYGLGLDLSWQLALQATFIVGVASALGSLSFVPNGAGVTEISDTGMLLALVAPFNPLVTPALAATAALMQGFFHKWFRVLVGLAVGFIFRKRLFTTDLESELEKLEKESA